MKNKKILFMVLILLSLFVFLPFSVNAFTQSARSYSRAYEKAVDFKGANEKFTGSTFYEIWLTDPSKTKSSEYEKRIYCIDPGIKAPPIKITRANMNDEILYGGPACALIKYPNDKSIQQQHDRIVYIKSKKDSKEKCSVFKYESGDCAYIKTNSTIKTTTGNVIDKSSSKLAISKGTDFTLSGDYYVASANVVKTGKIDSYTIKLTSSANGAIVTDSEAGTTNVTSSSASTLYIKIPKANVNNISGESVQVMITGKYKLSCKYSERGLILYSSSKSMYQKLAYPTVQWKQHEKTKSYSRSDVLDLNITGIMVKKVDSETLTPLFGAKFGVYSDASCTTPVKNGETDLQGTTDLEGKVKFDVADGTYYVKELTPPSGYSLDSTCHIVTSGNSINVHNSKTPEDITTKLTIMKVDTETAAPIQGAVFNIFKEDQTTLVKENVTTNENGVIEVTDLEPGTYYVLEIESPDNYAKQERMYEVYLDGEQTLTIENNKIVVQIMKLDITTEKLIQGAEFKILDEAGEEVAQFTTNDKSVISIPIKAGKYKLVEEKVPNGYVNLGLEIEFEVDELGYVAITSEENDYYNLYENTINVYNEKLEEEVIPDVPKTGVSIQPFLITAGIILIGVGGYYIYYNYKKVGLKK